MAELFPRYENRTSRTPPVNGRPSICCRRQYTRDEYTVTRDDFGKANNGRVRAVACYNCRSGPADGNVWKTVGPGRTIAFFGRECFRAIYDGRRGARRQSNAYTPPIACRRIYYISSVRWYIIYTRSVTTIRNRVCGYVWR